MYNCSWWASYLVPFSLSKWDEILAEQFIKSKCHGEAKTRKRFNLSEGQETGDN